jgi:hypothetical protein
MQSTDLEKKKLNYLKQKAKNHEREIELLKMKLQLKNQIMELKRLDEQTNVIEFKDPTMKDAAALLKVKAKNGSLKVVSKEKSEDCALF